MSPQIGPAAGQLTVETAVKAMLDLWLPTYVVAAARRYGMSDPVGEGFPFRPKSVIVVPDFVPLAQSQLPYVQVACSKWTVVGRTERGLRVSYDVAVYVVVGAQNLDDVRFSRACYEDAVLLLWQHQSLGIAADGLQIVEGGPSSTEFDADMARTLQASVTTFRVTLDGVMDPFGAPGAPDPLPDVDGAPPVWPDDPEVLSLNITYQAQALSGDGSATAITQTQDLNVTLDGTVYIGLPWSITVQVFTDIDHSATFDLTNWTAAGSLGPFTLAEGAGVTIAEGGLIIIALTAEQTATVAAGPVPWRLDVTLDGSSTELLTLSGTQTFAAAP